MSYSAELTFHLVKFDKFARPYLYWSPIIWTLLTNTTSQKASSRINLSLSNILLKKLVSPFLLVKRREDKDSTESVYSVWTLMLWPFLWHQGLITRLGRGYNTLHTNGLSTLRCIRMVWQPRAEGGACFRGVRGRSEDPGRGVRLGINDLLTEHNPGIWSRIPEPVTNNFPTKFRTSKLQKLFKTGQVNSRKHWPLGWTVLINKLK